MSPEEFSGKRTGSVIKTEKASYRSVQTHLVQYQRAVSIPSIIGDDTFLSKYMSTHV